MDYSFYSDQLGSRGRKPWGVVVGPGDSLVEFSESERVGVKFVNSTYEQNGKWSHTTWRVILPPGSRLVSGHLGWETGTWREALSRETRQDVVTWLDAARALGVSVASVMDYARQWHKRDARHFDEVDRKLAEADDAAEAASSAAAEPTTVAVSFGAPTRRRMAEGFWEWPLAIRDETGNLRGYVRPGQGKYGTDNSVYIPDPDLTVVQVLDVVQSSGYHGGYVTVRLALPAGWTAEHGPQTVYA